jgi:hypothetical protein
MRIDTKAVMEKATCEKATCERQDATEAKQQKVK